MVRETCAGDSLGQEVLRESARLSPSKATGCRTTSSVVLTVDQATMAHEMIHAAGLEGHDRAHPKNLMAEPTDARSEMFKFQVQAAARAYYAR